MTFERASVRYIGPRSALPSLHPGQLRWRRFWRDNGNGSGYAWLLLRSGRRGVKDAEVITARLIQDERGWLRLAGLNGVA